MSAKSITLNRILLNIIPSVFFTVLLILYISPSRGLTVNLIAIGIGILLLANIFIQNKIISLIMGIASLLISFFFCFALLSDVINGKATIGYLVGVFLVILCIAMSALLILSFDKRR